MRNGTLAASRRALRAARTRALRDARRDPRARRTTEQADAARDAAGRPTRVAARYGLPSRSKARAASQGQVDVISGGALVSSDEDPTLFGFLTQAEVVAGMDVEVLTPPSALRRRAEVRDAVRIGVDYYAVSLEFN